jgi:hypothetical protein
MQSHLPAGNSPAVVFAITADGLRFPVIEVTHPAFLIPDDPASLAARRDAFLAWDRRNSRMPRIVMRLASRRSPLLRKVMMSDNGYLDSISTYKFKIGADQLPPGYDGPVDRKVGSARSADPLAHAAERSTAGGSAPRTARRRTGRAAAFRQYRWRAGARQHQRADHALSRARR